MPRAELTRHVAAQARHLRAQPRDIHVHHVRSPVEVESPHLLQQVLSSERLPAIEGEVLEQGELL
jgi:hypothetical protein